MREEGEIDVEQAGVVDNQFGKFARIEVISVVRNKHVMTVNVVDKDPAPLVIIVKTTTRRTMRI